LKALLYAGRSSEERQIDLASTKVGQLAQPFVNSNRNVFMDRYFTLYSTVQRLFEHGHTAIGTVFAHRCDVLACLRKAARHDPYSTLAVYEHNKKITMINYVPRKNSSVLLDYNLGKGGVDSMDAKIEDFCYKKRPTNTSCDVLVKHIKIRYQNQKSMQKLNMPSSATDCPKIINVTDISYKTIKSIKMPRARTSKINVKPLLFIVKINWICDAENGYALKALLYAGRSSEERQIDLASTKVGQLAQPFVNSNRNVFMDRYFTLYSTVQRLFEHGHTAIGTVFAHRCDVLACLRKAARHDPYSTLAVYEHNKKITMINYVPRKNSSVLLLT
ncbi:hypothetical protein T01_13134, partial [Trichinella spiralis]